jgi:hypothetical protein
VQRGARHSKEIHLDLEHVQAPAKPCNVICITHKEQIRLGPYSEHALNCLPGGQCASFGLDSSQLALPSRNARFMVTCTSYNW